MPEYQIVLLPRHDYWAWVAAARGYAVNYRVNLTSDPDTAGRYMAPQQVVTIAGLADGYPAQGDIRAWFRLHYPDVRLDVVPCESPREFKAALDARAAAGVRYLLATDFQLRWPTDFARVNQGFGQNPELYRRWNLPGHEGLDIFAHHDAKIYACADGEVFRVDAYNGNASQMPYGNSVRLQHRDGYQTVYAHLSQALVQVGDRVRAGQVIGLANSTGNSSGSHLHLTLKKAGATEAGETNFPNDIVDPTPYMAWPDGAADVDTQPVAFPWPAGHCLVGVHGRADGPLQAADRAAVGQARIEAVKLLTTATGGDVDDLRAINPNIFIMVRLFAVFDGRVVLPEEFANWLVPEMEQFYQRGIRHFEVHNEPNLRPEGWTQSWNDGKGFNDWFIEVRNRLKQAYPEALLGYPGLSPGEGVDGLRAHALTFLTESDQAARLADWIGLHCYWVSEAEFNSAAGGLGYLEYRRRFPDKLLFITEFSNPTESTDKAVKGQQYVRYYHHLRGLPGMGAAFSFVLSSSSAFASEVWRNEDGSQTPITGLVGARQDEMTPTPPPPPPG